METHSSQGARTRAALAASLAGLLFGFDTAVVSGVTGALRVQFALTPAGLGFAVSAALWGTLIGATCSGRPGDLYGSRRLLVWIAVAYIVSAVGSSFAGSLPLFVAFRFLGGLAIGGSSVLAPVYIAEVSPAGRRGFLVGLFQFNIVLGILVAYLSNFVVGSLLDEAFAWRVKLAVAAVPSLVFLLAVVRIPESPRWLASRGRAAEAAASAERLGMMGDEWGGRLQGLDASARLSWRDHRRPILLALAIAAFNQLSGINAILYYLNEVFAAAGFDKVSADVQAVAIGAANLFATLFAMNVIDRVGRRPLLLFGATGTAVALGGVAAIYGSGTGAVFLLPLLILFIVSFAVSQGAVIWVYLSEIFPTSVRARGQAMGSATHWVLNAAISFAFPIVAAKSQSLPFVGFAAAMVVQMIVVWRWFPETRGVPLEQMDALMTGAGRY